jgi:hypothetical protein
MEVTMKKGSGAIGKIPGQAEARLVSAARRTRYGRTRTYATFPGENEAVRLLEQSLNEENQMNAKLNELSETILLEVIELENLSLPEECFLKYLAKSARTKQRHG